MQKAINLKSFVFGRGGIGFINSSPSNLITLKKNGCSNSFHEYQQTTSDSRVSSRKLNKDNIHSVLHIMIFRVDMKVDLINWSYDAIKMKVSVNHDSRENGWSLLAQGGSNKGWRAFLRFQRKKIGAVAKVFWSLGSSSEVWHLSYVVESKSRCPFSTRSLWTGSKEIINKNKMRRCSNQPLL